MAAKVVLFWSDAWIKENRSEGIEVTPENEHIHRDPAVYLKHLLISMAGVSGVMDAHQEVIEGRGGDHTIEDIFVYNECREQLTDLAWAVAELVASGWPGLESEINAERESARKDTWDKILASRERQLLEGEEAPRPAVRRFPSEDDDA